MSSNRPGLFIKQDGFIYVGAFVKHCVRLEKAAAHQHVALIIDGFKRNPGFIKVAHFGRE